MSTTLFKVNKNGSILHCDARCYNAKSKACDCICGGINHQVGRKRAILNTRKMLTELLEVYGNTLWVDEQLFGKLELWS